MSRFLSAALTFTIFINGWHQLLGAEDIETSMTVHAALNANDTSRISGTSNLTEGKKIGFIFHDYFTRSIVSIANVSAAVKGDGSFAINSFEIRHFTPGKYQLIARQYQGPFLNPTDEAGLFRLNSGLVNLNKMPSASTEFTIGAPSDVENQANQIKAEIDGYSQLATDLKKLQRFIISGKKDDVFGLPFSQGIKQRGARGRFMKELNTKQSDIAAKINARGIKILNDDLREQLSNFDFLIKALDLEEAGKTIQSSKPTKSKISVKAFEKKIKQLNKSYNRKIKDIKSRIAAYEKGDDQIAGDGPAKPAGINKGKPSIRTWRDATGKHTINAAFVKYENNIVTIRKLNGEEKSFPIKKLSDKDQVYVWKVAAGPTPVIEGKAVTIKFDGQRLLINGTTISEKPTRSEITKVLGDSRAWPTLGSSKSDRMTQWINELDTISKANPGDSKKYTLNLMLGGTSPHNRDYMVWDNLGIAAELPESQSGEPTQPIQTLIVFFDQNHHAEAKNTVWGGQRIPKKFFLGKAIFSDRPLQEDSAINIFNNPKFEKRDGTPHEFRIPDAEIRHALTLSKTDNPFENQKIRLQTLIINF